MNGLPSIPVIRTMVNEYVGRGVLGDSVRVMD
jgi:hypothetical protein